jgi:membrane dipeptidase
VTEIHEQSFVIDGLIIANFGRDVFEAMARGGLTAANCTCCVWEGFSATMDNIAKWLRFFDEHADCIRPVHSTEDIRLAKKEGRTGIILGFQNTSAFEDQLTHVALFKSLGVGIAQLTYNTQNLVGSGCYESRDGGLSDFGREVVAEMNRVGMMCDLSHVGPLTSRDAILASTRPVCYSHCLPASLKHHPRNKSDDELRFIADHGGFVGVTMFPPFLKNGTRSTLSDVVEAIDHVIGIAGEENVGIGTDFTQGYGADFFEYLSRDKGYARKLVEFGAIHPLSGFETIADMPNLSAAMEKAGWPHGRIARVLGGNWLHALENVWAPAARPQSGASSSPSVAPSRGDAP